MWTAICLTVVLLASHSMVSGLLMPNDWLLLYSPQTLVASTETGVEANSQSVAVRSVQAKMGVFTVPSVGALGKCSSL